MTASGLQQGEKKERKWWRLTGTNRGRSAAACAIATAPEDAWLQPLPPAGTDPAYTCLHSAPAACCWLPGHSAASAAPPSRACAACRLLPLPHLSRRLGRALLLRLPLLPLTAPLWVEVCRLVGAAAAAERRLDTAAGSLAGGGDCTPCGSAARPPAAPGRGAPWRRRSDQPRGRPSRRCGSVAREGLHARAWEAAINLRGVGVVGEDAGAKIRRGFPARRRHSGGTAASSAAACSQHLHNRFAPSL